MALEAALNDLKAAFDGLARVPGGDYGGFRTRTNNDIAAAANELIVGIKAANANYLEHGGTKAAQQAPAVH